MEKDQLVVVIFMIFKDGSERSNYRVIEKFAKKAT
jgi:hypothetical protein